MATRDVFSGTVVSVFPNHGHGFIRPDHPSPDVFFHVDKHCEAVLVNGGIRFLIPNQELPRFPDLPREGNRLVFMARSDLKGPRATHWDYAPHEA